MYRLYIVLTMALASLSSCLSLPGTGARHNLRLYSRGVDALEIARLKLKYTYRKLYSTDNYFYAELSTVSRPIELIQVPQKNNLGILDAARKRYYDPDAGKSYVKIQTVIPEAAFKGKFIYRFQTQQAPWRRDDRLLKYLLLISEPDSFGNILCIEFLLYPSRRAYLLRVDLRPANDYNQRVPKGTPAHEVANILSDSEQAALFHNQTTVGVPLYY